MRRPTDFLFRVPTRRLAGALVLLLHVCCALTGSVNAHADESRQVWFTAYRAPLGSMSGAGLSDLGVYLRWDVTEGDFPADVALVRVLRDGALIEELDPHRLMTPTEVAALYAPPADPALADANLRRQEEIIAWLDLLDDNTRNQSVNVANFADRLVDTIDTNPLWAFLASRIDFNVAQARQRGRLDLPEPGPHQYLLIGVDAAGDERRLGQIDVEVGLPDRVPAAQNFRQVTRLGRCDAPEAGREHFTVALDWDPPGDNVTEQYIHGLVTAGFDLYRSTSPHTGTAPPLDIAALASSARTSATGAPLIPGLEKINDQPIIAGGGAEREARYNDYNPEFTQFIEFRSDLEAAGLKPGDTRAYYLVARDLSGNYGATAAATVTVPDRMAPPAPWSIRLLPRRVEQTITLQWDPVELGRYLATHQDGRTYCNLDNARLENRLRFVADDEACGTAAQSEVDFGVSHYRVYRFNDPALAARFADSDGDGFNDADERLFDSDPEGAVCDPTQPGGGLQNYLARELSAADRITSPTGNPVFELTEGNITPGRSYWYRIAAVDSAGNMSALSAPLEIALDPLVRPTPEDFTQRFGRRTCGYALAADPNPIDGVLVHDSGGRALNAVSLDCGLNTATGPEAELGDLILTATPDLRGGNSAKLSFQECATFADTCGGAAITLQALDPYLRPLVGTEFVGGAGTCERLTGLALVEDCTQSGLTPLPNLSVLPESEGPIFDTAGLTRCVDIFYETGDGTERLSTLCPGDAAFDFGALPFPAGQLHCFSTRARGDGGLNGLQSRLGCFSRPFEDPSAPVIAGVSFSADNTLLQPQFVLPPHPISAVMFEYWQSGDRQRQRTFLQMGGRDVDVQPTLVDDIPLPPPPDGTTWSQEWCMRSRSVLLSVPGDLASGLSPWSQVECATRGPTPNANPDIVGWPAPLDIPRGEDLEWFLIDSTGELAVVLGDGFSTLPNEDCIVDPLPVCDESAPDEFEAIGPELDTKCTRQAMVAQCPDLCVAVDDATSPNLGFVAYRQSRKNGVEGNFVQVSPLIDQAFCRVENNQSRFNDPFIKLVEITNSRLSEPSGPQFLFVDHYPNEIFRSTNRVEYRYQLVFFDADGEISHWRSTSWKLR